MKLHRIEIALALALCTAFIWGAVADATQRAVADKVTRLHVRANSDTEADQALKLRVRDRVLPVADALTRDAQDAQEARRMLREGIEQIRAAAELEIRESGAEYDVRASIETEDYFPRKDYDGFSLPSGEYTSLNVVIGEGQGQNWWCVVFPPLCVSAATDDFSAYAREAGLTESEIQMIARNGDEYEVRFLLADMWNSLRHKIGWQS